MVQMSEFAGEGFHAEIGRALMRWRRVETMLFRALVDVLSPLDATRCETIWRSHSHSGQVRLVHTLITAADIDEETLSIWRRIKTDLQAATDLRNRIAHSDTAFIVRTMDDTATSITECLASHFAIVDPQGRRDIPPLDQDEIEAAGVTFQTLANRIDALLAPTPRLRKAPRQQVEVQ